MNDISLCEWGQVFIKVNQLGQMKVRQDFTIREHLKNCMRCFVYYMEELETRYLKSVGQPISEKKVADFLILLNNNGKKIDKVQES